MFKKILIANRGEIACRVIRTAKKMGIATVAVYSEADREALHVRQADEAVAIGPAPSAQSYLVIDKIIEACRATGAEAVHPGYGFLSENAAFAQALDKAVIAFIGPNIEAIAAMGDKIESKKLAAKAGVSTVPGHIGVIADTDEAVKIAREIGYPVMIKASAGGGGKGMRIARGDDEVADGFRSATSEAKSSFADDRVFIEKFIEETRHIEIQVLADGRGTTIHLGERECSIQRRHQKVIEEAPSPFLDKETRAAMGAQAVTLAEAVDYRSAGTVEFIVDRHRNFYFLEMNTRLQVEHPVTEMVTGIDLVEQMIRIAAGEKLAIRQGDVTLDGWAIEARVYAEDPYRNFLPSIGRLIRYRAPDDEDGDGSIRVDTGVGEGAEISMFYDPMIAKLVAYGADRPEAIERLARALDAYYVRGVEHNMGFLAAVIRHPRFAEGRLSTDFIADEYPDGFGGAPADPDDRAVLIAVAAAINAVTRERDAGISGRMPDRPAAVNGEWTVKIDGDYVDLEVTGEPSDCEVVMALAGEERAIPVLTGWVPGEPLFEGQVGGRQVCVQIDTVGAGWRLHYAGLRADVMVVDRIVGILARRMPEKEPPDTSNLVLAPMPGLLVSLAVEVGQAVKAGEEVAVVEAMKMENILRADRDGTVKALHAEAGANLSVDQPIVEFE
ncbi:MAG: acetyl/propionyl/methylcrotonyl-CoA carboxylase subunit alpha [Bauldia litoralis]